MSSISGCSNSRVNRSQVLRAEDWIRTDRTDKQGEVKDDRKSDGGAAKHTASTVDSVTSDSLIKSKHGHTAQLTVEYGPAVDVSHRTSDVKNRAVESTDNSTSTTTDNSTSTTTDNSTSTTTDNSTSTKTDNGNQGASSAIVKNLLNAFNKQFSDLKAQHEAETNALLEKFNEVTVQLKALSEQSAEQIKDWKDQLGGLGAQLGSVLNKLDLLGNGQSLSLRSIGLFSVAAQVGDGALEKLIEIIGQNSTSDQLRSVQSQLQSVSGRIGGGQTVGGLNLLG